MGSWYTGRGGTTFPYDPQTGSFGTPTGDGLVFVFRGDGTFTKAVQSYVSTGSCTTGWTAFVDGTGDTRGDRVELHAVRAHIQYTSSCVPSADSDKPIPLEDETLTWAIGPYALDPSMRGLTLTTQDGASSQFREIASS